MRNTNLFGASYQWANRPLDERHGSPKELLDYCLGVRNMCDTEFFPSNKLRVFDRDGEVLMMVKDHEAKFSHYGFGQLCERAHVPTEYMRNCPADLAVANINHFLERALQQGVAAAKRRGQTEADAVKEVNGLMYRPNGAKGEVVCRSMMTKIYKRIWDADVAAYLCELETHGWRVPPARPAYGIDDPRARPATEYDVLNDAAFSLSIRVGDPIAPAGLYGSDHDLWAFMVQPNRAIKDPVSKEPLFRGFFIDNSEVGDGAIGITTFLYRHVCGNHIVWGASEVRTMRMKHTGPAQYIFADELTKFIDKYDDSAAAKEEEQIRRASKLVLGKGREEVVQTLLDHPKLKRLGIGKVVLNDAYNDTEMHEEDGDPNTLYAMINGLTRVSQITSYGDDRAKLDEAAGKLMLLAA